MYKILLRFDDLSPFHNIDKWREIEHFLLQEDIKPILAVIPDNRDSQVSFSKYQDSFWTNIKRLQKNGWTIALHGLHHELIKCEKSIIKTNDVGEICDLSFSAQSNMIKEGIRIINSHGINVDLYCAPAHSFDSNTLDALLKNGISIITDGFYLYPGLCRSKGIFFVPQQLWRMRRFPFGVFTVCYHHNNMSHLDVQNLKKDIMKYKKYISSFDLVMNEYGTRHLNFFDKLFSFFYEKAIFFKRLLDK